nr:EOG090X0A3R [Sida crystallina]
MSCWRKNESAMGFKTNVCEKEWGQLSSVNNAHARDSRFRPRIEEIRSKRVNLFDKELKRQQATISRLEKIEVHYEGHPENTTVIMNKGISTPFNCAQHISELLMNRSIVAEVDGELWDMHRPLENNCTLRLLHVKVADSHHAALVNKTFWRSCSFILGGVIENSFRDEIPVVLHSFPSANVRSGSFVYDVQLGLACWEPKQNEFRMLGASFAKFCQNPRKIQRLDVSESLALEIFRDNVFKSEQIPHIAAKSSSKQSVPLYRVGDHIDISVGPMISSTDQIGRCSITAVSLSLKNEVHKLDGLYRFQGVALPSDLFLNSFAYGILESRARKLNEG